MVGVVSYWASRITLRQGFIGLVSIQASIIPQDSSPMSASYLRSRSHRNQSIFMFPCCSHPSHSQHTVGVRIRICTSGMIKTYGCSTVPGALTFLVTLICIFSGFNRCFERVCYVSDPWLRIFCSVPSYFDFTSFYQSGQATNSVIANASAIPASGIFVRIWVRKSIAHSQVAGSNLRTRKTLGAFMHLLTRRRGKKNKCQRESRPIS